TPVVAADFAARRRAIIDPALRSLRALRSRLGAVRQPRRAARIALALWILWAVVVWNVAFDRVIVVAGRRYITAATQPAGGRDAPRANMDDFMRPAVARGLWVASAAGGAVLIVGLAGVRAAAQRGDLASKGR